MKQKIGDLMKRYRVLVQALLAFLGTWGCLYLGDTAGVPQAAFSVTGILLLPAVYWLLSRTGERLLKISDKRQRRKMIRYAAIVSYLFSLSMLLGGQLQTYGQTDYGVKGKGMLLIRAAFLGVAVFPFGVLLFEGIGRAGGLKKKEAGEKVWKTGAVFGFSVLGIFVCLIPVWLAYYPIIMSYDFHRQVNEAVKGFIWFNPYQPLAHTWVIWCFVQLGNLLGDLQTGMAGMALFQMLLYALVTGYACAFIHRVTGRKWTVVASALFFGVFPLNSVLVLCTTKDVLFSILFLLFCLLLAERNFFADGKKKLVMDVLLVLEGCVMIQFRNNAIYAVAVYAVFWLVFAAKKEKLRVLLLGMLLVAGGKGLSVGITEALGTEIGPAKVEMYSVPIQQFARVGQRYADSLDPVTWDTLNSYVSFEFWPDYNPPIADTVKASVAVYNFSNAWEGHQLQLLKDWVAIGLRYPSEYIDAFLELTRGYWFFDDRSHAECLGWGVEGRMGVLYTYHSATLEDGTDIPHESKFPWLEKQLEKIVSGNAYYSWPVISLLFKPAFYCWGLVLIFMAFLFLHRRQQALFCGFVLLYMATMLLGPVVQIRYVFPAMVLMPVLLGLLILPEETRA